MSWMYMYMYMYTYVYVCPGVQLAEVLHGEMGVRSSMRRTQSLLMYHTHRAGYIIPSEPPCPPLEMLLPDFLQVSSKALPWL